MSQNNNYMDDQLDLMCEGFFDNIDDLLDFSADEQSLGMADSNNSLMNVPPATQFPALDTKDCPVVPVPEENKISNDISMEEDWFTNFLYDATFEEEIKKNEPFFQSFSPSSVLEPSNLSVENTISSSSSSSSSSASSNTTSLSPSPSLKPPFPARARSKRPRRPIIPARPPTSLQIPVPPPMALQIPGPEATITKIKIKVRSPNTEEDTTGARRCRHCGIQKTPQWRAGPMGPKTLCNACGVRYKSGRLFPEYRPAASPTFVPSVHSNSHKKVVEIRNKVIGNEDEKVYNPAAKNCDLLKYIRV